MAKVEAQIHMEDEFLQDETLVANLQEQLDILETHREGHLKFGNADRKIKAMVPWDGEPHRYRIGPHVIELTNKEGGREVEYTTQPGYSVKVNPREAAPAAPPAE